jgi:uncharacterized protein (TIGR02217 family)
MFYDVELDICPAFGWQGGPQFNTRITALRSGLERRNAEAAQVRHQFTLPFANIRDADYLQEIKAAHLAMRGNLHSFKVKDWSDFEAFDEPLGVAPAGSTPVQLRKLAAFGLATYSRTITKPLAGVVVKQGGTIKAGTLDTLTGLFTPSTAWTPGAALTWSGEFRVPVRFDNDYLPMTIDSRNANGYAMNGSVQLIEVFGE